MTFKNAAALKKFLLWASQQNTFSTLEIDGVKVTFREPESPSLPANESPDVSEENYRDMLFYSGTRL